MTMHKLFLICPDKSEAGALETLPPTEGITIVKTSELLSSGKRFSIDDKICITSEASIDIVKKHLNNERLVSAIDVLKDKSAFRDVLSKIYPDYFYETLGFDDISSLKVNRKAVIKPSKGCFGTAVRVVDQDTNMKQLALEIQDEISNNSSVLSESVLSKNDFILEEFVEGEEYAVDVFFDAEGNPQIVNIFHHPLPDVPDYLHMIYYTSAEIFQKIYDKAMTFFIALNAILKVRNMIMHAEFKLSGDILFPIEINSMRIGGMGLGSLIYYALGINPYRCFIEGRSPDWKKVWHDYEGNDDIFAFFIAYNGSSIDKDKMRPNVAKLRSKFTHVILEELFDYQEQLAFGVFCLKETKDNLKKLLSIEFNNYFEPI